MDGFLSRPLSHLWAGVAGRPGPGRGGADLQEEAERDQGQAAGHQAHDQQFGGVSHRVLSRRCAGGALPSSAESALS